MLRLFFFVQPALCKLITIIMATLSHSHVLHLCIFAAYCYTAYFDFLFVDTGQRPGKITFGKFSYLTIWNLCLQTIYYGLCVLKNFTSDPKRSAQLQRWRDNMHACIAFPVGMFVVATFWALYAIDRELVFPKALDRLVPFWLNHMLHTAVFPFLMIDKYLVHHQYPVRHKGIPGSFGLALIYLVWILFIAYYEGFWVYPVLQVLAMHERAIFIGVCMTLFASFYTLGEAITMFMWRKEVHAQLSTRSKLK